MDVSVKAGPMVLAMVVLATVMLPRPVLAEQKALEEVIVTAEKRAEPLSQVPMSVAAVSGKMLKDFNGFSVHDLSKFTSGIDIAGGNFDDVIAMRGLSTRLNAPVESRVSVYWDGAYVGGQPRAVFVSQFDMAQVEVLRGPQGTLYGQTSPAGAIVFKTRDPSLEHYQGDIQQTFSQRRGSDTQFGLSIPVVKDKFGIRLSGVADRASPQGIRNVTLGRTVIDHNVGGRVVALWEPTDSFKARLSYNEVQMRGDDDYVILGNGLSYMDRKALANTRGKVKQNQKITVLDLNWMINDGLKLTSISTYQSSHIRRLRDEDFLPYNLETVNTDSKSTTIWSEELRLASEGNDFWNWMTGVFVQHSNIPTTVSVFNRGLQVLGTGPSYRYLPLTNYVFTTAYPEVRGAAAFLHNEFHLPANNDLTVGLRYNYEDRTASQPFNISANRDLAPTLQSSGGTIPVGNFEFDGIAPDLQKSKNHAWTGTVKLAHHFSQQFMLYGAYDRAWRNGVANISATPLPPSLTSSNPETSDNFEIGTKVGFWRGRASFNMSVYYQFYNHFQYGVQSLQYLTASAGLQVNDPVTNAKQVVSRGFDSELRLLLTDNWTLTTSLSYNNTEFTDFKNAPCNGPAPLNAVTHPFNTCNLNGKHAGQQPEWSMVVMSQYTHPITGTALHWFLRGLVKAESKRWDPDVATYHHGYATLDLYVGLSADHWQFSAWVKNAFDMNALMDVKPLTVPNYSLANTTAAAGTGTVNSGYRAVMQMLPPRTFGITGSYHF